MWNLNIHSPPIWSLWYPSMVLSLSLGSYSHRNTSWCWISVRELKILGFGSLSPYFLVSKAIGRHNSTSMWMDSTLPPVYMMVCYSNTPIVSIRLVWLSFSFSFWSFYQLRHWALFGWTFRRLQSPTVKFNFKVIFIDFYTLFCPIVWMEVYDSPTVKFTTR